MAGAYKVKKVCHLKTELFAVFSQQLPRKLREKQGVNHGAVLYPLDDKDS